MFPSTPRLTSIAQFETTFGLYPVQILSLLDYRCDCDDVFFTGSIIEGFGNRLSDIDVLIVTDHPRSHIIKLIPGTTRWVDVVYISREKLVAFSDSLPDLPLGFSDWEKARPASFQALEMLHDYTHGLRVTNPWQSNSTLLHDDVKSKIARSWALSNIISARARWHDASGAYLDGHYMQSQYIRSICLGHCIDAYTGLLGETDINVKWRWSKLERISREGKDIFQLRDKFTKSRDLESFSWSEVASIFFDVITLFVENAQYSYITPQSEGNRFEITNNRWVLVDVNGFSHEVPAPAQQLNQVK